MDQELSSAKAWAWERINLSLHSARVLQDGLGLLLLFWYLHGWIFPTGTCMGGQKLYTVVHGWAWPHIPWYMDGSLFLQNWYMDGWWVVALQNSQRHTPTQTKVEYPPRGFQPGFQALFNHGYCLSTSDPDPIQLIIANQEVIQGFQLLGIAWREKHQVRSARTHKCGPGLPAIYFYRAPDGVQGESPTGVQGSAPLCRKICIWWGRMHNFRPLSSLNL